MYCGADRLTVVAPIFTIVFFHMPHAFGQDQRQFFFPTGNMLIAFKGCLLRNATGGPQLRKQHSLSSA